MKHFFFQKQDFIVQTINYSESVTFSIVIFLNCIEMKKLSVAFSAIQNILEKNCLAEFRNQNLSIINFKRIEKNVLETQK